MAGRIANGQENRFVLFYCLFKGLFAPGVPMHWIKGVLQKIGAFLMNKTVWLLILCQLFCDKRCSSIIFCELCFTAPPPGLKSINAVMMTPLKTCRPTPLSFFFIRIISSSSNAFQTLLLDHNHYRQAAYFFSCFHFK